MKKNKRGWIRIVEAFIAIVLLLGFLLLFAGQVNKLNLERSAADRGSIEITKEIETNPLLRNALLSVSVPLNSSDASFPEIITNFTRDNSPGFDCDVYVCSTEGSCTFDGNTSKSIYSSEAIVFSNSTFYSPRKLKLFCY